MYQRHTTSSNGGAQPQQNQQQYQFQRARSLGTRPQSQLHRRSSYDGSNNNTNSNQFNNNIGNSSYSSLPDTNKNSNPFHSDTDGSSDYGDKYNKTRNRIGSMSVQAFLMWRILPCLVLILLPWIPNQFVRNQIRAKKAEIETIIQDQTDLVERLDKTHEKIKELKLEVENLHKDNELSYQELKFNGKTPENLAAGDKEATGGSSITDMESEEYAKMEEEEETLVNRIDRLEKTIQKNAVKRLGDRYGNGQYRFKVNVRDLNNSLRYFVIETAMLEEMPHAIDHFFRMIEKKLWDGLALTHEPNSQFITATPMKTDESHTWVGQRFVEANLTHMAFTEHSPTYPPPHHRKFAVAFSGRPGGPGFYISLENDLEYAHEHESTFGVVMEGRDILYQLFLQKDMSIKRILTIESIDILPTKVPKERKP